MLENDSNMKFVSNTFVTNIKENVPLVYFLVVIIFQSSILPDRLWVNLIPTNLRTCSNARKAL